jgi:hypothetical protein
MRDRFETDEWAGWVVATIFGSLIIPAVVIAIGSAWAAAVEIVRLGNEHLGQQRGRVEALRANFLIMIAIGIAAVWIGSVITAMRKSADGSTRRSPRQPSRS